LGAPSANVTLASFQRALCDLIASPALCLALRADPEATLARYELSARERRRLTEVVWQRGMSTNCTLYRSNRVTPVYTMLNYTCRALGGEFASMIDQFWDAQEYRDRQFLSEVERFGAFLRQQIAAGTVSSPFAGELLEFELATNALAQGGVARPRGARSAGRGHAVPAASIGPPSLLPT
jgi:hypothetical protein